MAKVFYLWVNDKVLIDRSRFHRVPHGSLRVTPRIRFLNIGTYQLENLLGPDLIIKYYL